MLLRISTFLLLLAFITSCTTEAAIERREDRLIGSWKIDRARFNDDRIFSNENIINEYRGDELTFFSDGSLEYIERNGEIYYGFWYIDAIRGGGEDDTTLFTLDADFYDVDDRLVFRWLGEIDRLNRNNFNISISDRDGELRLRWDRI